MSTSPTPFVAPDVLLLMKAHLEKNDAACGEIARTIIRTARKKGVLPSATDAAAATAAAYDLGDGIVSSPYHEALAALFEINAFELMRMAHAAARGSSGASQQQTQHQQQHQSPRPAPKPAGAVASSQTPAEFVANVLSQVNTQRTDEDDAQLLGGGTQQQTQDETQTQQQQPQVSEEQHLKNLMNFAYVVFGGVNALYDVLGTIEHSPCALFTTSKRIPVFIAQIIDRYQAAARMGNNACTAIEKIRKQRKQHNEDDADDDEQQQQQQQQEPTELERIFTDLSGALEPAWANLGSLVKLALDVGAYDCVIPELADSPSMIQAIETGVAGSSRAASLAANSQLQAMQSQAQLGIMHLVKHTKEFIDSFKQLTLVCVNLSYYAARQVHADAATKKRVEFAKQQQQAAAAAGPKSRGRKSNKKQQEEQEAEAEIVATTRREVNAEQSQFDSFFLSETAVDMRPVQQQQQQQSQQGARRRSRSAGGVLQSAPSTPANTAAAAASSQQQVAASQQQQQQHQQPPPLPAAAAAAAAAAPVRALQQQGTRGDDSSMFGNGLTSLFARQGQEDPSIMMSNNNNNNVNETPDVSGIALDDEVAAVPVPSRFVHTRVWSVRQRQPGFTLVAKSTKSAAQHAADAAAKQRDQELDKETDDEEEEAAVVKKSPAAKTKGKKAAASPKASPKKGRGGKK